MTEEQDNTVVEQFEKHIKAFIRTGDPMVFGRLEGMREVLEIYGRTEELKTTSALLDIYREQMSDQCNPG